MLILHIFPLPHWYFHFNKKFLLQQLGFSTFFYRSKKYVKPTKGAVKQSFFFGLASWGRNRKMQKNQNIYTNGRNATAY